MAIAYGCRVPLFGREWEHHIMVGVPDSMLGLGRDSHVQLGVATLTWLYHALCDGCTRTGDSANLLRLCVPHIDLDVGLFPSG
jgi:hypothetical protein